MPINRDMFKRVEFWAVAVPAFLALLCLVSLVRLGAAARDAQIQTRRTLEVLTSERKILAYRRQMTQAGRADVFSRGFDGLESARDCARRAMIPEDKMPRGGERKASRQSDGTIRVQESYRLSNIHLLQLARFIDTAERDYASVTCTNLNLSHARSKSRDSWDATLDIQYTAAN